MAQAVAAWSGARARGAGGSPRIGFLLGSRRYEAREPVFAAGAELRVSARCELVGENGLGMLTADEIAHWRRLPEAEREPALLCAWVAKEAWYKAVPAGTAPWDFRSSCRMKCWG